MPAGADPLHLSIVIPVYNEERRIGEALRRVHAFLAHKNWEWELIVSDDGSTDATERVVEDFVKNSGSDRVRFLKADQNRGKGAAVRRGVLETAGRYVLMTDSDLSAPVKEADKLLAALEAGADVAIGSRAVRERGADVRQSFKRWLGGRIFNMFVTTVLLRGFKDTQCGFKAFRHEAAMELFGAQTLDSFSFDVEILYLARRKGYEVREISVMWNEDKDSRVRFTKHTFPMVLDLFRLRRRYGRKR